MRLVFSANARNTGSDAITVVRLPLRSFSMSPPSWSACTCVRKTYGMSTGATPIRSRYARASGDGSTRMPRPFSHTTKLVRSPEGSKPWLVPRGVTPNRGRSVVNWMASRSSSGITTPMRRGAETSSRFVVTWPPAPTIRTSKARPRGLTQTSPPVPIGTGVSSPSSTMKLT